MKMKRLVSIILCFILAFTLYQPVFAAEGDDCEIVETEIEYATLNQALTAVQNGETIRLLEDIEYDSGIVIEDKSITFDLNDHTLNVVNDNDPIDYTAEELSGLYVKGNASVALEGDGEFNVTGTWYGVYAECENEEMASASVTNAVGIERDGVSAQSSKVIVKGDITSNGPGGYGVYASYENAEVTVEGDVYANGEMSVGVDSDTLALVTVKGSVIVNGNGSIGIKAGDKGTVTVEGDVTVSGSDCIGVSLLSEEGKPSIITVKGVIEALKYVLIETGDGSEAELSFKDGSLYEVTLDCRYYTIDDESFVYVSMFAGGSGTVGDPYLIAHGDQLYNIGQEGEGYFQEKHYKQAADIDLSGWYSLGQGWKPIGYSEAPFIGTYDGDGYTISNLCINREGENYIGLFAYIGLGAEVRNVGLINVDVTGHRNTGGLAGGNAGLVENSYVTGEVSGTSNTGGLTGHTGGSVTDSYFEGTVTAIEDYAGGLVGYNYEEGSITSCSAVTTVVSDGNCIGGLAGGSSGSITDSYAISTVTGVESVGGLTGGNEGLINNSYADGDVTGNLYVGGLIGSNVYSITDSFFTGTVTASGDFTGGLVGENSGPISNCHADDAIVTSTGDYVGGLAGGSSGSISNSYATGAVTGNGYAGGLIGESLSGSGIEITASYSTCDVEGARYVGGLVGSNETYIFESFATGSVTGTENDTDYTYAGGLVGYNAGPISDSYAWGAVSGREMIGGLVGYNGAGITNCYEIGAVTGEDDTGGLIGSNHPDSEIINSYWNNNISGQTSSDGGESKGSVTMKQQVTYEDWNFDTIWSIDTGENDGYPFLRWQVPTEFAGGSGAAGDPYLISTEDHLNNVRNHLDKHFKQTADLDLNGYRSGSGWEPIGDNSTPFTGVFDGDGHTISDLFIDQVGVWNNRVPAGLFGYTGAEAEIRDLTLEDADVTGCYYVGSLVGYNSGNITDVIGSGSVTGEWDTGGLAGFNNGSITGSAFTGDVTGADIIEYGDWTGGLVGYNLGTIADSWADAAVVSEGDNVGGLVGENLTEGIITESCSAGTVTAYDYTGGLAGSNSGEMTACYSICTVNGTSDVGGLVGGNSGPIADSFAVGTVAGNNEVGGLAGSSTGTTVTGCYWDIEASGQSTSAGGTGKTTGEMKQATTFENWDLVAIWGINDSDNNGYPFLRWQGYVVAEFEGGSGSEGDPYLVAHADQLYNVRNHLDKHFKLIEDINLSGYSTGEGWEPIGDNIDPFTGSFDGDEHIISGLVINDITDVYMGLFGYTGAEAEIRNLGLTNVNITGGNYVGGLVGRNKGQVINSSVSGDVTGRGDVGGLAGLNEGSITDSHAVGTATDVWSGTIGGLVGDNSDEATITNCHAEVTVTSDESMVGGLVGANYGGISESYAVGEVEGECEVGGLVGYNSGGTIDKSYATGAVTGTEIDTYYTLVGGLVGSNYGTISDSYARGAVFGQKGVGGLVGYNSGLGSVTNSYATGTVNGNSYIGGLAGENHSDGIIMDSYWDTDTSLQASSDGGTGKTTADMKQQDIYEEWDFAAIWGINGSDNNGYPFLRWQGYGPGEPNVYAVTVNNGTGGGSYEQGVTVTIAANAAPNGQQFKEWTISPPVSFTDGTSAADATAKFTMPAQAVTATAIYENIPATIYTITLDTNGGSVSPVTMQTGAGGKLASLPAPTRSGYTFDGWYTAAGGGTPISTNTVFTANTTIYAQWTQREDNGGGGGGGSNAPSPPTYKAEVKEGSSSETTLPVTVGEDAGTASVDAGSQGLSQGGTVITIPTIPDIETYLVGIPVPDLSTADVQGTLSVNTDAGSVTIPSNMLTGVSGISGSKAEIAIGQGDKDNLPDAVKAAIGDRPLVQLSLSIDGNQTHWSNPDAPVTVSIPYTPTAAELANPESIVVWYIDGSGKVVSVPNGHYDPETGTVTFTTTHFSYYAVSYNQMSFKDVANDAWYAKAVSFIAAREITTGTGGGNFSPESKLTRGQFIVMLMKAYSIAPDLNSKNNFADVGNTYYTGYLAAAKRLAISAGIGNNMFAPEKEITRQEMFTLLYNALKVIGQLPTGDSGKGLSGFTDAERINSWAKEAMTLLVKTGTVGGSGGALNPTGTTTRAEMAQALYNLLGK